MNLSLRTCACTSAFLQRYRWAMGRLDVSGGSRRELSSAESTSAYTRMLTRAHDLLSETRQYSVQFGIDKNSWHNGDGDAFRHATASALMNCEYGSIITAALGLGYEVHDFWSWLKHLDFSNDGESLISSYENLVKESAMDIHNDLVGIQDSLCREKLTRTDIARSIFEQT